MRVCSGLPWRNSRGDIRYYPKSDFGYPDTGSFRIGQ